MKNKLLYLIIGILFLNQIYSIDYKRQTEPICKGNGQFISGICYNCKENCTDCSSPGGCDACDNEWYIMDDTLGYCVVSESYLQKQEFVDYRADPLINEADGCDEGCRTKGSFICSSCLEGYRFVSGTCQQCDNKNCKDCSQSTGTCQECFDGFANISGDCQSCQNENCLRCNDATSSGCIECKVGYMINSGGSCIQCINGCANCIDSLRCQICQDGYYQDDQQLCQLCGDNIALCKDENTIIQCIDNYALLNGRCINVENVYGIDDGNSCKIFQSQVECQECFDGYTKFQNKCYLSSCKAGQYKDNNQICQDCGDNVTSCTFTADNSQVTIVTCDTGYYLINNQCYLCTENSNFGSGKQRVTSCSSSQINSCQEKFTISNDKSNCLECPDNCKTCTINNQDVVINCVECESGFIKNSDDNLECLQCNTFNYCNTCESNLVDCIDCPNGLYLTEFKNCSNQIQNCYIIVKGGCKACRLGYRRSDDGQSCIECVSDNQCESECVLDSDDNSQIIKQDTESWSYQIKFQVFFFSLGIVLLS